MLTIFVNCLENGTESRLLVERFGGAGGAADRYSLTLTALGGLGLVQLDGLSRGQVEGLARGIGQVLESPPPEQVGAEKATQ